MTHDAFGSPARARRLPTFALRMCLVALLAWPVPVHAGNQDASPPPRASATPTTICGQPVAPPSRLPPAGSGPVVYLLALCFSAQGNVSLIGTETYLHYVQLRPSRPSQDDWVAFDASTRETMLADFRRLWATNFLDDLTIEATDYPFANGVVGKLVTYHLEERQRARIITYGGSRVLDGDTIDKALREKGLALRVDAFTDPGLLSRVRATIRDLLEEKGYLDAVVSHSVTPVAGSPKVVNVTFDIDDGPRVALRDVEFLGNDAFDDETLTKALKTNVPRTLLTSIKGGGHYLPKRFEEDVTLVEEFYRDHGYIDARLGQPELRALETSEDGRTRWAQLRVPVHEGRRYRVGTLAFDGNTLLRPEALRALFNIKEGEWYSHAAMRAGFEKARELYGAAGHMEFTGYPDLTPRSGEPDDPAIVDVVLRIVEGPRFTVNAITFKGNATTRDEVIRREMRLLEGAVFNTQALKATIQRINQLGYFQRLEGNERDVRVEKSTSQKDSVDVTLTLSEQNRDALQFGGGVSQYDGVFANVSYTTTNFLGRGESVTVAAQRGNRSSAYQLAFTEPFVFDRPLSTAIDLYSRKVDFLTGIDEVGYSEVRSGITFTAGYRVFGFARAYLGYGYEVADTAVSDDLEDALEDGGGIGVPLFTTGLDTARNTESRLTPTFVYDSVDVPLMSRRGRRLTLSLPVSGGWLGGTVQYARPEAEIVQYLPITRRTGFGLRAKTGFLRPYGRTSALPYYLRYYLGGEYEIRGYNIRTVGPTDADNRGLGGDKFVLFNAEYYFDVFGPVRALLFHDAGQAFAEGSPIDLRQLRTSSGVEVRFLMPMLNVPFRLIYAWNIYRDGFQPARALKFAVGTTF
jgi:outer membrane protein insertion porin family